MYYQFCILCLFRPLVDTVLEDSVIQPRDIRLQAAQSILVLTQSYGELFTFRRVPVLIPYFVFASGLLSLAREDAGYGIDTIYVPVDKSASPKTTAEPSGDGKAMADGICDSPSHIKMSTTAYACQLLAEISSAYPAAAVAKGMLQSGRN